MPSIFRFENSRRYVHSVHVPHLKDPGLFNENYGIIAPGLAFASKAISYPY